MPDKSNLIDLLKKNNIILKGKFTLSSGQKSNYYINIKKAITNPLILSTIAQLITTSIKNENIDKIAGPELGAVPLATAISLQSNTPLLIIRKTKKDHGTSQLIEGELKENDQILIIEDVTTTGKSLLKAIQTIQKNGGTIKKAFTVVDRNEGAKQLLQKENINLEPLINVNQLL